MDELDANVAQGRTYALAVVRLAAELLDEGAGPAWVRRRFSGPSVELCEELELRAVLASGGDVDALVRTAEIGAELRALEVEAAEELRRRRDQGCGV